MNKSKYVVLAYHRVPNTELSSGGVYLAENGVDFDAYDVLQAFESAEWKVMLTAFASALSDFPDAGGVLQRTDRPGLIPYFLPEAQLHDFRNDPVKAIKAMTFVVEPRTKVERVKVTLGTDVPVGAVSKSTLRAGIETLAEVFGTHVYARRRLRDVECPGCGFWSPIGDPVLAGRTSPVAFDCQKKCKMQVWIDVLHEGWAGFHVHELLSLPLSRFYFPREWNTHGIWISRSDLSDLWETFKSAMKESVR